MTARLLVTGAGGLLGRSVVPQLEGAGWDVFPTARTAGPEGSCVAADLTMPMEVSRLLALARPQAVLHLAGRTSGTSAELLEGNVTATTSLLSGIARAGIVLDRLVVTGSAAEYGEGRGRPLREDDGLLPVTPYGAAKAAQTSVVRLLGPDVVVPGGVTVVRPFNVVSPRLPPTAPLGNLRRQLLAPGPRQRLMRCGRLDAVRDFLTADAVCDALVGVLRAPTAVPVLNICSGQPRTLGQLLDAASAALGLEAHPVVEPSLASAPAALSVVGDAGLLHELGLSRNETLEDLTRCLLQPLP